MEEFQLLHLTTLLTLAFLANIPLGYLRESSRRYSWRWFLYIHLSIPILLAVRLSFGLGWWVIPFSITCAVGGQVIGGRVRRRRVR